jgi:hypothetical protein
METIIFKARPGTRAKLQSINSNISALLRQGVEQMIQGRPAGSALAKAGHLCGIFSGPGNLSTSKDYLKQYAQKKPR